MDIYIKPVKKASFSERKEIYIKDIAEVVATKDVVEKVEKMKILETKGIEGGKKQSYLVSVTDIIKLIKKTYPDYTVNNVGEMDTVIDYAVKESKDNKYWKWSKIAFVSLVLLTGSATAIMSFHSDSQMPKVFESYYWIFFKEKSSNFGYISIPYSLGLATGIIVFFNHFAGKNITDDPTPIEVEMTLYESDVIDTEIHGLAREKIEKSGQVRKKTE